MAKARHYNYFDEFVELVDYSCQSADILYNTLFHYDLKNLDKKLEDLHRIEHNCDLAKHEMTKQLASEFIAPIEREDILTLSDYIDDITDSIEDVLILIHMYNVKKIKPEAIEFASLIKKCCNSLKAVLQEFHNYKKSTSLLDKIIEVNSLEETADKLYYTSLRKLYSSSNDAAQLLVWTQIYERLEKCCDKCENAANIVESIAMKNS